MANENLRSTLLRVAELRASRARRELQAEYWALCAISVLAIMLLAVCFVKVLTYGERMERAYWEGYHKAYKDFVPRECAESSTATVEKKKGKSFLECAGTPSKF